MKKISFFMRKILIKIIELYQKYMSPLLKKNGVNCKYYPSCSEYTKQAISKYGCIIGIYKGFVRILKCNPFSKGGSDPLN